MSGLALLWVAGCSSEPGNPKVPAGAKSSGGMHAVIETDNLADIHLMTTALAAFTFRLEPVVDVMDAVDIELQAMAWRETVG